MNNSFTRYDALIPRSSFGRRFRKRIDSADGARLNVTAVQPPGSFSNQHANRIGSPQSLALAISLFVVILGFSVLAGCAEMKTRDSSWEAAHPGKALTGVHYSLPRGVVDMEGKPGGSGETYAITIGRHNESEGSARYRLVRCHSPFDEDTTEFHIDANGLLTSNLNITSESKVPDIIFNLTDTAINLAKIGAKAQTMMGMTRAEATPRPLKPFKVSFDPLIRRERLQAVRVLESAGFGLTVSNISSSDDGGKELSAVEKISENGAYYHPLTTVKIVVSCEGDAAVSVARNVSIPDPSRVAVYALYRAPLVKKETKLTFVDGEPRDLTGKHPSEVLEASLIPVTVTSKVLAALPDIGSLFWKPKPAATPNSDLTGQTARLKAQQDLDAQKAATLKQRQELANVQKNPGAPAPVETTGMTNEAPGNPASSTDVSALQKRVTDQQKQIDDLQNNLQRLSSQGNKPDLPPVPTPTPAPEDH